MPHIKFLYFCSFLPDHVLKEHPYRIIAHSIKAWGENENQRIQVVGLSASLTYAVDHKAVVQALSNLCHDLSISKMISPTEEELKKSGYVPQDDSIETMHKPWAVPDGVIPGKCASYIIIVTKRVNFRIHFSCAMHVTYYSEHARLPHMMHEIFMKRIDAQTTTPFAKAIYQTVRDVEREIDKRVSKDDGSDNSFKSPLSQIKLSSWEDHAYRMRRHSCLDSPLQILYALLEIWYVALRMIVQSWEEEEQLVLVRRPCNIPPPIQYRNTY